MARSANDRSLIADTFPSAVIEPASSDPEISGNARMHTHSVLAIAAWHSIGWLYVANLIGVWLAILLLYPAAGRWLGEWSYGRWTAVHLNFQLYGWMALPLVAWAIRIYRADRGPTAEWSRVALMLWSIALALGGLWWLNGNSSGKLFLDWSGFVRVFYPLTILFLWVVLVIAYKHAWRDSDQGYPALRVSKIAGLVLLLLVPFAIYVASSPTLYPAVNPDTGGPTGASQLESTLIIVLILFLLPYGLTHRKSTGRKTVIAAWAILLMEALLCLALGRQDVSHHRPAQFISLGSLLVWVPLIPAYFNAFRLAAKHPFVANCRLCVVGIAGAQRVGVLPSRRPRPAQIHRCSCRTFHPGHGWVCKQSVDPDSHRAA